MHVPGTCIRSVLSDIHCKPGCVRSIPSIYVTTLWGEPPPPPQGRERSTCNKGLSKETGSPDEAWEELDRTEPRGCSRVWTSLEVNLPSFQAYLAPLPSLIPDAGSPRDDSTTGPHKVTAELPTCRNVLSRDSQAQMEHFHLEKMAQTSHSDRVWKLYYTQLISLCYWLTVI